MDIIGRNNSCSVLNIATGAMAEGSLDAARTAALTQWLRLLLLASADSKAGGPAWDQADFGAAAAIQRPSWLPAAAGAAPVLLADALHPGRS